MSWPAFSLLRPTGSKSFLTSTPPTARASAATDAVRRGYARGMVRRPVNVRGLVAIAGLAAAVGACRGEPVQPPRCAIDAPRLASGRLHTDGTRLVDELGRIVYLRGFNAGSRSKWAPYAPFDFTLPDPHGFSYGEQLRRYLDGAVALGANVLRVTFSWQALEPVRGQHDEAYLTRYGALLDAAWARGIRTLVDFHQDVYAENFCGDGFPAWTIDAAGGPPPAPHHDCPRWYEAYSSAPVQASFDRFWSDGGGIQADYVAMWKRVIERFKDHPGVIGFEPINEPHQGSADAAAFEPGPLTAFHGMMAGVVQAAAPEALVFVDPLGLTSTTYTTRLGLPSGPNLVYAPHYYQPATIFGGTGNDKRVAPDLAAIMKPAQGWNVPTFIGEWGAGNEASDAADHVAAQLAAFDELGLSGTQWEYSITSERWNDEPLDVAFPGGELRPVAQAWMRPQVRALAGALGEMTWDADTLTFTLRYTPSGAAGDGAATEIAWPAGAVFAGHVESLEGACHDASGGRLLLRATGSGEVRVRLAAAAPAHAH